MKKFVGHKIVKANIYRIQVCDSVLCGYFCIGFICVIFKGKSLTDFTNLFSLYNFKENDKVIFSYWLKHLLIKL